MTLDMWGPEKQFFPLQISVTDNEGLSPFSIAVLRGHISIAGAIIAIAKAQFKPQKEETQERFTLEAGDDEMSDYDSDSGLVADDDIRVRRHIINDRFTIENVGEIKTQVESWISPLNVLTQVCQVDAFIEERLQDEKPERLVEYAICKDDPKLLKFLLQLGKELTVIENTGSIYTVLDSTFELAMRLGRLDCLKELIRCVGTGMPLDKLVEKSGVVTKEKPIYYQGLSIHGEKRADWAAASRGVVVTQPRDMHPPLLVAAYQGRLETVEWFLGSAPGRYYEEFASINKHDERVAKLAQAKGGFVHSITNWLTSRGIFTYSLLCSSLTCIGDLVLHCAVMSKSTNESIQLVKYLVKQLPHCISVKSMDGYTPLALAFYLHRVEFAKILIQAGANQTVRDKHGRNLLHLLFFKAPDSLEKFQQMLDLVDPLLVSSMLVERSSLHPGSVTPFSQWINTQWPRQLHYYRANDETREKLAIARKILDFAQPTGQKHLELLNGAGNTVVHDAVSLQVPKTLKLILERRPDLLHRENAAGCTPMELAEAAWTRDIAKDPPNLHVRRSHDTTCVLALEPESFLEDCSSSLEPLPSQGVYGACRDLRTSKKRKLVTLYDANEVAKRLATPNSWTAGRRGQSADEMDEVVAWLDKSHVD